jgi:hypothetical protein
MMIGTGVVFAEPGVDKGMVRRLVVHPQEEELSWLKVGLELKFDDFERDCAGGEGFRLGWDRSRDGVHLVSIIVCRVFMDEWCWCWYCVTKLGA